MGRGFASSGRVNQSPPSEKPTAFTTLTHLVLLIQLGEDPSEVNARGAMPNSMATPSRQQTYLVDVGYGGVGIVRPMLLEAGHIVSGSSVPEEHRLVRAMHPDSSLHDTESSRDWVLQYRCGSRQPDWTTLYMFSETETFSCDWIAYSQWLCTHPVKLFRENVIAILHFVIQDEAGRDDPLGAPLGRLVMTGKRVQKRIGTQSETIKEFHTERDRVRILKEDFGIIVDECEVRNIKHPAALP